MSTLKTLSREEFLALEDRRIVAVTLPDGLGVLHVRGMTGTEKDAWEAEQAARIRDGRKDGDQDNDLRAFRARFLARVICDERGALLFSAADVERIGSRSARVLDVLFDAAHPLSAVTRADVEALLGNSGSAPSGASGSTLP